MRGSRHPRPPVETFARMIADLVDASERTQGEIARLTGYANANIITMFKQGTTRVPGAKVVALAHALGVDPGRLLRRWFEEYEPELLRHVDGHLAPLGAA